MIGDVKTQADQNAGRYDFESLDQNGKVWWTSTAVRFLVIPIVVALLLASGVAWIRRLPAGERSIDDEGASIQVRLLPAPEPTAFVQQKTAYLDTQHHGQAAKTPRSDNDVLEADLTPMPPSPKLDAAQPFATPDDEALKSADLPNDSADQFQQRLLHHLARFQRFPSLARQERVQGTVHVDFVMRRDGSVVSAWISTSSGARILDQEAIDMLRRAEPLPGIPEKLPEPLNIKLPVVFKLP